MRRRISLSCDAAGIGPTQEVTPLISLSLSLLSLSHSGWAPGINTLCFGLQNTQANSFSYLSLSILSLSHSRCYLSQRGGVPCCFEFTTYKVPCVFGIGPILCILQWFFMLCFWVFGSGLIGYASLCFCVLSFFIAIFFSYSMMLHAILWECYSICCCCHLFLSFFNDIVFDPIVLFQIVIICI